MQLDAAGNICLAGSLTPQKPEVPQDTSDAFLAKVSADGSKLLYFTALSGCFDDVVNGIALGSDGSAYVTGLHGLIRFSGDRRGVPDHL
jgi:hypothetical protein